MAQAARRGASPQRWDGIYRQRLQQSTANPDEHLAGARLPQSNPINPRCRPAPHLRMRTPRHGAATALSERSRVISKSPGTQVPAAHSGTFTLSSGKDSCRQGSRRNGLALRTWTSLGTSLPGTGSDRGLPVLRASLLPWTRSRGSCVHRGLAGRCSRGKAQSAGRPSSPSPLCPSGSRLDRPTKQAPPAPPPPISPAPAALPPGSFVARPGKETFFMLCLFPSAALLWPRQRFIPRPGLRGREQGGLREALMGP